MYFHHASTSTDISMLESEERLPARLGKVSAGRRERERGLSNHQVQTSLVPGVGFEWEMVGSFAAYQADRVARQGKVGALGHSAPRCLHVGEGDERLPTPLATQVIQDEHAVRLELGKNSKTRPCIE